MRRFAVLLLMLLASPVHAAAVADSYSFSFDSIKLVDLARIVFSDVLSKSYVLDSDFLADSQSVGFTLNAAKKSEVQGVLYALLERHGFAVTDGKFIEVVKKPADEKADQESFYYNPKFRPVSYITDLVASLFDHGRFSSMSQIRQKTNPVSSASIQSGPAAAQQMPVQDSGSSALSLLDKEKDAFVFQGSKRDIEKLKMLLSQVDVPAGQVLVRAHVFEVTTGASDGSAFSLAIDLLGARFSLGGFKDLGNTLRLTKGGFDAAFSVLASDSRFKVVSSPSLRVKSGENARFSVGADVPVLGAVQLDKNGNPVQSVEYKPSGVILSLTPRIRGQEIELQINQQLSSFIATTTGVNNSPTLTKREILTNVGVSDGDVIVLGGLDENRSSQDSSGLPFLPAFMRSHGRDESKTELLLVLETQKI